MVQLVKTKGVLFLSAFVFLLLSNCSPQKGNENSPGATADNKGYKLIAHRGGITEGKYSEYDPASIREAIDRGYYMLEIDIWQTRDGELILNHDQDFSKFFNVPKKVNEMTWAEIKELRSVKGNFRPMLLEELAQMCAGKIKFMLDLKEKNPSREFYQKLEDILEKYDLLSGAYFIDNDAKTYF